MRESNMLNHYKSIENGTDFTGEIPDIISIPSSNETENGFVVTEKISATRGSKNYQEILDSWMLQRGFIRDDKEGIVY